MALSIQEQINQQIDKHQSVLIALPVNPSTDAICAALVLRAVLESKEKEVVVTSANFKAPEKLSFITSLDQIVPTINRQTKYLVEVDTTKSPISDISYNVLDNKLQIQLTPKSESIQKEHIDFKEVKANFDLIITLSASELATLGKVHSDNHDLFENTPIINIDHRPENEQYGHINWVALQSASTCELIVEQLFPIKKPSKGLATLLLTGIMEETHSFRSKSLNAKTMDTVSRLMQAGAEHEVIVNKLYRTKTVGLLRLWGYVLDRLKDDATHQLAWSTIPSSIFSETGTDRHHISDLMQEVLSHSPQAKTIILFIENEDKSIDVQVKTLPPLHAKDLIKNWQPTGDERLAKTNLKGGRLKDIEEQVVRIVKTRLAELLDLP
jgi:nanoRNase/pAp phosphatase (c-di-AMP/oligoRNAs hydrolase)